MQVTRRTRLTVLRGGFVQPIGGDESSWDLEYQGGMKPLSLKALLITLKLIIASLPGTQTPSIIIWFPKHDARAEISEFLSTVINPVQVSP